MAQMLAREILEARVARAYENLSNHLATKCAAPVGSIQYRAYWGKHTALDTAHKAALSQLHQFELPQFDTPLFGLLPVESADSGA